MTWDDLGDISERGVTLRVTGAIFGFSVSILPTSRCLRVSRMAFVQNRRLSIFSHWIIIERPQNWPDLRSPISKFRDTRLIGFYTRFYRIHEIHCYSHQSLKVSRQSCGRCSHDEHSNLFLTWPWETWVWNFHSMCGKDARTGVLKTAARSCEKPTGGGGCSNTPRPGAG